MLLHILTNKVYIQNLCKYIFVTKKYLTTITVKYWSITELSCNSMILSICN